MISCTETARQISRWATATVQTEDIGFGYNGESDLDLQYAMALVGKSQPVSLYQVGDLATGASFNNLLDALDGSYCTFEGGDDPYQDGFYPGKLQCFAREELCSSCIRKGLWHNQACQRHFYILRLQ